MKVCNKCHSNKPDDLFHKRGQGLQPYCKVCKKADDANYRVNNMDYFVARSKLQKKALYEWYNQLKSNPCTDCKQRFDPVAMHWDHLPTLQKTANVSNLVSRGSKKKVIEEIKKCELVCANCHAVRTKTRHGENLT